MQVFNSLVSGDGPGVAWHAHIGGFVAGIVLLPIFKRRGVQWLQAGRSRRQLARQDTLAVGTTDSSGKPHPEAV